MPTEAQFSMLERMLERFGLPLLILIILAIVIWRVWVTLTPYIIKRLSAGTDALEKQTSLVGEFNELMRHNSATIENNTAALTVVAHDKDLHTAMLNRHMDEEGEMLERMEDKLNSIDRQNDIIIKDVKVLKDRSGFTRKVDDK